MNRGVLAAGLVLAVPLVGVLLANMGRDPHAVRSPLVGREAPAFVLNPVGGGPPVSLAALRGRPVVLNFWATWCVPCHQEHGVLVRGATAAGQSIQFLGVSYEDEDAAIQSFLEKRGSSYPTLSDEGGKAAIAYGIAGVPETFFINPAGIIVAKYVGPLDAPTLAAHLAQASR